MAVTLTLVLFPEGPRGPLLPGGPVTPEGPGRPRRPRGPCSPGGPGGPKITVLGFWNTVTYWCIRATFHRLSKITGFALLHLTIGLTNSRHFFYQIRRKFISNRDKLAEIFRILHRLREFTSSKFWLVVGMSVSFVIGQRDLFGFGSTTPKWK